MWLSDGEEIFPFRYNTDCDGRTARHVAVAKTRSTRSVARVKAHINPPAAA